jgi:Protein of unknown function, DUF481
MLRLALFAALVAIASFAHAQDAKSAPAKPEPDVLIFTNGDKLTGKLVRAAGGSVVFHSDMAGDLTISFDKIKELRSGNQFALLKNGQPVTRHPKAEEGPVTVVDNNVTVTPPSTTPVVVPSRDVAYLIDKDLFDKSISGHHPFTSGWNGALTGGITLVRATTTADTYTAGISLVRVVPPVDFLPPSERTIFNLNETYGKQTSPVIPQTVPASPNVTVLTNIFHADAEQDWYLNARLYALADTAFDHNYSQGLSFQQIYGGGIGFTAIKDAKQEFDLKGDLHYERQDFSASTIGVPPPPSLDLFGSTFAEAYIRHLPRKFVFTENGNYIIGWNNTNAYSGNITGTLAVPVWHRLGASVTVTDNYLNNPTPGFEKNSFQFITGVTYTLH